MKDSVLLTREDSIGLITVNNPPVNALSNDVRKGILNAVRKALDTPEILAVILTGTGNTFSAGADINEFGKPPEPPPLPEVCNLIESSQKPIVAALNGAALGGGLEVALSAHFRFSNPSANIGLPEVHLGLLPGSGGTQRLPRLVGAGSALELMLKGSPITAKKGLSMGVIDRLAEGEDFQRSAREFAREILSDQILLKRSCYRTEGLKDHATNQAAVNASKADLEKSSPGLFSPILIIECVEASLKLPFQEGLLFERERFLKCLASPQREGLIHAFFADRRSKKFSGISDIEPRKLEKLAVIGGGTMGAGITVAALNASFEVVMIERDEESLKKGSHNVEKVYDRQISKGRMSHEEKHDIMARYFPSTEFSDIEQVDLVIEAVFEEMEVKKEVFRQLDQHAKPGAVLASNTSYLNIDEIASCTSRPTDVLGLHFFSPANIMKLLEIVIPAQVEKDVVATGLALAKRMGKVSVRAGNSDGFIGNRILGAYADAAGHMMEDGASPYQIDAAVREFGYPIGPFQMFDLAGGDIGWANRKRKADARDPGKRYVHVADRLCEKGWFGQKTGRGYYLYEEGSRIGNEDPEVLGIIDEERSKKGITARGFNNEEIMRRYMAAMVNEGAKVLFEKVAMCPSDIDVTKLYGYAFPRYRGGPMKYADMYGVEKLLNDINEFAEEDPVFWVPSELLVDLVKKGQRFDSLN